MAIKDVESKCWILALFVRNDGERFLLGDGNYEFNEKQLHFAANTIANDVVEVQGNDGYLLAGQVRRPSAQSFDGYVGDSSTSKAVVEQRRRAFFEFFRKGFFYKVVYVFPDGSAIQRKRGFLVDAPEVKELYQIYPEYHVALNFEDINYYYYDEDASGQEIYGESATIRLNSGAQGGGLVWLPIVEGTLSGEGTEFTLYGTSLGVRLNSAELKGDTVQNGNPTPSNPIAIQTATGEQTVTITDRGEDSQEYTVELGRNFFDVDGDFSYGGYSNQTTSNNDGTVTTTSDFSQARSNGQNLSSLQPNTKYTLSAKLLNHTSTSSNVAVIQIVKGLRGSVTTIITVNFQTDNQDITTTFTTPADTSDLWISINSNGASTSATFGNIKIQETATIELCKIGDYQDYIYKSGDDWYVHKATNKIVLNGTGNYNTAGDGVGGLKRFVFIDTVNIGNVPTTERTTYCDIWQGVKFSENESTMNSIAQWERNGTLVFTTDSTTMTLSEFGTFLRNSPVTVYLIPPTPTDTKITDTTLIEQLNELAAATTYDGSTSFTVDGNGNLAAILAVEVEAVGGGGVQWDENGAVWEEGGSASNTIMIDSIDNVYPVLTITGRTVNPVITDVTTGLIFQYTGTITESQTLVVDMMNKTATLNGVSVVGNVTGDWLYLAPGSNRLTYVADNTNAPNATLEWQEIVG